MPEPGKKRVRRTPQERAAELDAQAEKLRQTIAALEEKKQAAAAEFDGRIQKAEQQIQALEAKKSELLSPKPPRKPRKTKKQKIQEIVAQAMKNGLKAEEIAAQLGIEMEG